MPISFNFCPIEFLATVEAGQADFFRIILLCAGVTSARPVTMVSPTAASALAMNAVGFLRPVTPATANACVRKMSKAFNVTDAKR